MTCDGQTQALRPTAIPFRCSFFSLKGGGPCAQIPVGHCLTSVDGEVIIEVGARLLIILPGTRPIYSIHSRCVLRSLDAFNRCQVLACSTRKSYDDASGPETRTSEETDPRV